MSKVFTIRLTEEEQNIISNYDVTPSEIVHRAIREYGSIDKITMREHIMNLITAMDDFRLFAGPTENLILDFIEEELFYLCTL